MLSMSVTEIDVSGSSSPAVRSRSDHHQARASSPRPGMGKAPDSYGAQISQIWAFSLLTGT